VFICYISAEGTQMSHQGEP